MNKNRRGLGFFAVGSIVAACSVDTGDVHFVPDDVINAVDRAGKASVVATGATGADDAGGAPATGGSTSPGGSGNKAGAATGTGGINPTGGAPGVGGGPNGGNGPMGGMGGGMPVCGSAVANRNQPLIDDFEDGNAGLPTPPLGGRVGGWYTLNDGSEFGVQVPPAMDPTRPPKPAMPGHDGKGYALYTSGKGFTEWGASLQVSLSNVPGMMMPCVYDASIHTGIRFWTMGTIKGSDHMLHFRVVTTEVADLEGSGTCDARTETCYDNFGFDVTLPGGGLWTQVTVRFADLKQGGWGTPKKFQPNHVLNLDFNTTAGAEFDFAIDQIEFF